MRSHQTPRTKVSISLSALCATAAFLILWAASLRATDAGPTLDLRQASGDQPIAFVEEEGGSDGESAYRVLGRAGTPVFRADGVEFASGADSGLRMRFVEPSRYARMMAGDVLPGRINRFVGNDPSQWRQGQPTYNGLIYEGLYPGVDLVYGSSEGRLKGTYLLEPGADPERIAWRYQRAAAVAVDGASGNLIVTTMSGDRMVEEAPVAWQEIDGDLVDVSVAFRVDGDGRIGFEVGAYDARLPLSIDPFFAYETVYDVSGGLDWGQRVVVDEEGNAYILARAAQTAPYIVVLKVRRDGTVLNTTFLGGSGFNNASDIAYDGRGHVVLTGWTSSSNFPAVNALFSSLQGSGDAFITMLSALDGSIVWSTYYGGNRPDEGHGVAVDPLGNVVVTGATGSTNFPVTANAVQSELDREVCLCLDGFVAKVSNDGNAILYGTYLGGNRTERIYGIDVDGSGNYFVAGTTDSPDLPLVNAVDETYGGEGDGFVARISADGGTLDYSTYLGGSQPELIGNIAVDEIGRAHVIGSTQSVDFPTTPEAFQPVFVGGILACGSPPFEPRHNCDDVFVTKLPPMGKNLVFSTFVAGSAPDFGRDLAVDSLGRVFIVGNTASNDFPQREGSGHDIYVAALPPNGTRLFGPLMIESQSPSGSQGIVESRRNLFVTGSVNVPADVYIARIALGD